MIEIRVDITTRSKANARPGHWSQRSGPTKAERTATRVALLAAGVMHSPPALPVTVTVTPFWIMKSLYS